MLGSLLLSSPADAEPEGPREPLAPATPVLAGRVGSLLVLDLSQFPPF